MFFSLPPDHARLEYRIVGILTFMSRINFMLSSVEHEQSLYICITSGPGSFGIPDWHLRILNFWTNIFRFQNNILLFIIILFIQYFKRVTYLARRPVYHMALWTYNWYIKHGNKRTLICTLDWPRLFILHGYLQSGTLANSDDSVQMPEYAAFISACTVCKEHRVS